MRSRLGVSILLFISFISLLSGAAMAQQIGFDLGYAGAQNYGEANPAYGISVIFPFEDKYELIISYHQWNGEDDNYTLDKNKYPNYIPFSRQYFGNKDFGMLLNYKFLTAGRFSFLFGLGLSQFEMINTYPDATVSHKYIGAMTLVPLHIKYQVNDAIKIYARGTLSAETGEAVPDWGAINIGLQVNPF